MYISQPPDIFGFIKEYTEHYKISIYNCFISMHHKKNKSNIIKY